MKKREVGWQSYLEKPIEFTRMHYIATYQTDCVQNILTSLVKLLTNLILSYIACLVFVFKRYAISARVQIKPFGHSLIGVVG